VEWQTRKHEGLVPKGVGVQLPPRALEFSEGEFNPELLLGLIILSEGLKIIPHAVDITLFVCGIIN